MAQKHFVQLKLGSKISHPAKVSTEGCSYVDDFLSAIKTTAFPEKLKAYEAHDLSLFEADGTTAINTMESIDVLVVKKKPLVVVVEPLEEVEVSQKPDISFTRHQDYKQRKAFASSRSFLNSIAVEMDKIYPIPGRTSKGKRRVTIGDVFEEAYRNTPDKPGTKITIQEQIQAAG